MDSKLVLAAPSKPQVVLESIDTTHLDLLRQWKNAHSNRFFRQIPISPSEQMEWYLGYLSRPDDYMFVVRNSECLIGCLGFRWDGFAVDVYNVIRGESVSGMDGMGIALQTLCSYAQQRYRGPIRAKILADNPVVRWSRKYGFRVIGEGCFNNLPYCYMEHDPNRVIPVDVQIAR